MTTFYYSIAKLIDRIHTSALYLARNIKQDRTNDFYQLSIVDAEGFLQDKIRTIAARIFADVFSPYARELTDPFQFDVPFEGLDGQIIFQVEFPDKYFDANLIPSILQAGEDLIIDYVVYEWIYHTNYDYRKAEQIYSEGIKKLMGLVGRRYTARRNYKLY